MAAADAQPEPPLELSYVLSHVTELLDARPEAFLQGDDETRTATLDAAKYVFDLSLQREQNARASIIGLMRSIDPSTGPQTRSQAREAAKRKRSSSTPPLTDDEQLWRPTPLERLYLEGMTDDQIWAQLELRTASLCEVLKTAFEQELEEDDDEGAEVMMGSDDEELEEYEGIGDLDDSEDSDYEDENKDSEEGLSAEEVEEESFAELRDPSDQDSDDSEEEEEEQDEMDLDRPTRPSAGKGKSAAGHQRRHPVLDDGFFLLADFNAETEEAEAKAVSKGRLSQDDDDDDDVAEDGIDLFAPVDDVGGETFEEEDLENGGEPYYKDFFAAPSSKVLMKNGSNIENKVTEKIKPKKDSQVRFHEEVRVKKIASRGNGHSVTSLKNGMGWDEDEDEDDGDEDDFGEMGIFGEGKDEDEDDDDMSVNDRDDYDDIEGEDDDDDEGGDSGEEVGGRETIERLKDDLFAEDEEAPSKDISTHEARQAEIAAQIAEFETKNVAPKEWTLMGEATSRTRPVNSLLEEDLDFERVMKPVPVVTEESVHTLEEIIKKRILENRFDDVVRKRPVDDKPFLPSRFFELNDQKSTQSLAQIYENEYAAAANGPTTDDRDGKLKKEHDALETMWNSICSKLDALSNAHFTPKPPKATISTISNLPAANLESAIPTTKSTTTMLAPEEIFAAPSDTRSRDEMTPAEKHAERNKKRKARKNAQRHLAATVDKFAVSQKAKSSANAVKKEKDKSLKSLVKTGKGVTVVGKKSAELKRQGKTKLSAAAPLDGKKLKL